MAVIARIESWHHGLWGMVRITDSDGAWGWGQYGRSDADISSLLLHRHLASGALGSSAEAEQLITTLLDGAYKHRGSQLGRAACGIDTALWDLRARRAGVPVWALVRADAPRELMVYASSMSRETSPEQEAHRFAEIRQRWGVTAFKAKVGGRMGRDVDASPGRTEALIPALRQVLGAEATLMIDANGGFSQARAIAVGQLLETHGYSHFEEPCPYWELEQTAAVARALTIPVAGGEQDFDDAQFARMIGLAAVDVVQCDIGYVGGFSRALAVGRSAIAAGLRFVPHSANTSLIHIFTIHLLTALGGGHLERNLNHDGPTDGLYAGDIAVRNGRVRVPTGNGWGVEPEPAWLAAATYGESRR